MSPEPEPSIFEAIPTRIQIVDAALTVLKAWLPSYIAEIERQHDLDPKTLPFPRSYSTRTQTTKWSEDQTPAVVMVSPGLAGAPKRDGNGVWRSPWGLGVAVITSGNTQESVIANSSYYGAAVRACLLQRQPLPGVDGRLHWLDEDYTEIPEGQSRSLAAARVEFQVLIPHTVDDMAGPLPSAEPPVDPYDPPAAWQTVTKTSLNLEVLDGE